MGFETTSKGLRSVRRGLEPLSKGISGLRRGLKPVPRLHAAYAEFWNHFQGAFPAGDGDRQTPSKRMRSEISY